MNNPKNWTDRELLEGIFAMLIETHKKLDRLESAVSELYRKQAEPDMSSYWESGRQPDEVFFHQQDVIQQFYDKQLVKEENEGF